MHVRSRLTPALFLLVMFSHQFVTSSNLVSNKVLTLTFAFSVQQIPTAIGLPFDYLLRKLRKEPDVVKTTTPPRTLKYYEMATNFFDWAFNELESDENEANAGPGRFDVDKMESSSSEEMEAMPKLKTMAEKITFLRKGRLGTIDRPKTTKSARPVMKDVKKDSIEYDDLVEKASVPELKNMLTALKKADGGIFTPIFSNSLTTSIFSFGTNMFKRAYCGWSPKNNYCISDHSAHEDALYFKRRSIRSLAKK